MNYQTKMALKKIPAIIDGLVPVDKTPAYKALVSALNSAQKSLDDYKSNYTTGKTFTYEDFKVAYQADVGYDEATRTARAEVMPADLKLWEVKDVIEKELMASPDATLFHFDIEISDDGGVADELFSQFKGFVVWGDDSIDDGNAYRNYTFVALTKNSNELKFLEEYFDDISYESFVEPETMAEQYSEWLEDQLNVATGKKMVVEVPLPVVGFADVVEYKWCSEKMERIELPVCRDVEGVVYLSKQFINELAMKHNPFDVVPYDIDYHNEYISACEIGQVPTQTVWKNVDGGMEPVKVPKTITFTYLK